MITPEKICLLISLISYTLAGLFYFKTSKNTRPSRIAFITSVVGLTANFGTIIYRTAISERIPLSNGYEFLLCLTFFTVLIYLLYERKSKSKTAGGPLMLIAALLLLSIFILMPNQINSLSPLTPALKSPWLVSHVLTAVFAYGGFALAAGIAVIQLRNSEFNISNNAVYKIVLSSFSMLSLSIVLGAIWAEQAWGSYWSWDPKETWALITWIIYAIYLHMYRQGKLKPKEASLIVITGFVVVLFTFFGVNFLMSGLHSYAGL